MNEPTFYYDLTSPYAYLAAVRIEDLIPSARWQPIAFAMILRHTGREPWSFAPDRSADFAEIARRSRERGLAPLRYPAGWPQLTYSLAPARACLVAEQAGLLHELTRELFAAMFVRGESLADLKATLAAATRAGLDSEQVRTGIEQPEIKERLRLATDEAIAAGVVGIPTVIVGKRTFWGDDQLEQAAAAAQTAGLT